MMSWILLISLIAISAAMLVWGFRRKDGLYQFPPIFAAAWLFLAAPQLLGIVLRPDKIPSAAVRDRGIEIALIMCVLCLLCGWLGYIYSTGHASRRPSPSKRSYSPKMLLTGAAVIACLAIVSVWKLTRLGGGIRPYFIEGGWYTIEWRGEAVKYVFFAGFSYLAFQIALAVSLMRSTVTAWVLTIAAAAYPISCFVFLGRRQDTILLGLMLIYSLYFFKGWKISRRLFASLIVCAVVFVVLVPEFRQKTTSGFSLDELGEIDVGEQFRSLVQGDSYAEFEGLVVHGAAINKAKSFDYGQSFYDAFVRILVPGQLVGEKAKQQMLLLEPGDQVDGEQMYGWTFPFGSFATGPLTAFRSFWFFGAGLYALLGAFAGILWTKAARTDRFAQTFYAAFAIWIPMSVINALDRIIPSLVLSGSITVFLFWCARNPRARMTHGGTRKSLGRKAPEMPNDRAQQASQHFKT